MVGELDDVHPIWKWGGRLLWSVGVAALIVHLYALALILIPAPITATMVDRMARGYQLQREIKPLDEISPHLVRAVIAAEDARFCRHEGVDLEAISGAREEAKRGGRVRGASTITQQTAKNVFLWNGGGYLRKLVEAWFSTFIDFTWGKRRVMETYLNVAEWGDGIFGAEAAAQVRFGKSAADLSEREAALLATVLPSPKTWRLDPPGPYVRERAGVIQARMRVVESEGLASCVIRGG